jgi:hypothetical protein
MSLADDDYAVRPRHPAEARQPGTAVGLDEHGWAGTHMSKVPDSGRLDKSQPARFEVSWVLPVTAREESEQREDQDDDENDPEDAHGPSLPVWPRSNTQKSRCITGTDTL